MGAAAHHGYHVTNILLHGLNAVLLWLVLRRLRLPAAWAAAAIFALHPMQVESVAWITERKNVLSGSFALSATLVYLRWLAPGGSPRPGGIQWRPYLALCALFVCALLSKTVTCTLPAVLLLIAWWRDGTVDRRAVRLLAPLLAVGMVMAAVTVWMEKYHVGAVGDEWTLSLVERGLVAGRALWFYAHTLVWPHQLAFIYPRWSVDPHVWWQYLFPVAAVAVIVMLYAARRRCGRGPLIAILCYAGTLVPALGFFDVFPMRYSFVADHFAYLAIVALIVLIAVAGADLMQRLDRGGRSRQLIGAALCAPLLLVLAVLTARQCGMYRDLGTLWADTLAKNPDCWMAHNNLGTVLMRAGATDANAFSDVSSAASPRARLDEAIGHFETALRLKSNYAEAYSNLGNALRGAGRLPEAIERCEQALRLRPAYPEAQNNLANALVDSGRPTEAIPHYQEALRVKADYREARRNLATVLIQTGAPQEAVEHFEQALQLDPDDPVAHYELGNALIHAHRLDDGIAQFRQALVLKADYPDAYNNLGNALLETGRSDEAIAEYEHALQLNAEFYEAQANLGRALYRAGRRPQAIEHFRQALRLQPDAPVTHNDLGVALAESGQLQEAIDQFRQVLALRPDDQEARGNLEETRAMKEKENRAQDAPQ